LEDFLENRQLQIVYPEQFTVESCANAASETWMLQFSVHCKSHLIKIFRAKHTQILCSPGSHLATAHVHLTKATLSNIHRFCAVQEATWLLHMYSLQKQHS